MVEERTAPPDDPELTPDVRNDPVPEPAGPEPAPEDDPA